ncbi:MAG: hypothetical protein ACQES0_07040 [Bacteroidota bacterium]
MKSKGIFLCLLSFTSFTAGSFVRMHQVCREHKSDGLSEYRNPSTYGRPQMKDTESSDKNTDVAGLEAGINILGCTSTAGEHFCPGFVKQ